MLLGLTPASAYAATLPSLASPTGLSLAEIKITGNEFIMLMNNTNSNIPDLSKYWLYDFNNSNPLAAGVSSSSQQLPVASLGIGQTILLNANGGSTCGAAVTAKLSLSLTDSSGFLEVVQTSIVGGVLVQTAGDAVSWSSGTNSVAGMIGNVPSSSTAPNGAYYRYQNPSSGAVYLWQSANQDTGNLCQLNVTIGGITSAGPVNPGNQLLPGLPPAAIFVTDDSLSQANANLPPSDVGLAAPVINELLPNPAEPNTDPEDEFIELYNSNSQPFDLSGFKFQTGTTTLHNYSFPAGTTVGARSFATYYSIDTNLSLSNSGGQVRLIDPAGNTLSQSEAYSNAPDGQTWALADGKWYWTTQPTPNATNAIHQLLAQPYALPTPVAKTAASKTTKPATTAKSTTSKKSTTPVASSAKPANNPPSLHPVMLAAVGVLALGYAAYEYRHDLQNRLHQFRRYRTARRATRLADQTADGSGTGGGSRRWQNHLSSWLGTRLW